MTTTLVTGGLGFIGSQYVRLVLGEEPQRRIVNLDCQTYAGNPENLQGFDSNPNYFYRPVDIRDKDRVAAAFAEFDPDDVVHFAAESHVDRSIEGPLVFAETNVIGTIHLLQAALAQHRKRGAEGRPGSRFLHVSTDEVYGSLGAEGAFREDTPYDPSSPYSASKAASDHFARAWYRTYGLPVLVTNCSNNYGPRQFPEKLIPLMINNALTGKALPVYGDGRNVRDWLFVEDHARALDLVRRQGRVGETYNIGGLAEKENIRVVELLCELVDELAPPLPEGKARRSLISFVRDRPGHDRRYAMDITKIQGELGWSPKFDFESGLRKTVEWYLSNQVWLKNVLDGSYQDYYKRHYDNRN